MVTKASDQLTVVDITDAYTVMLTSESYTFAGNTTHANPGSCATQVIAYLGNDSVLVSVGTITCPPGITASIASNGTASPIITFTVAAGTVSSSCEATIPLTVDGKAEFTKKFSFGVALKGSSGTSVNVSNTSVTYQVSTSGTTTPTGSWVASPPNVPVGQYLWTKTVVTYSDDKSTTSYSISRNGTNGSNGADALSVVIESSNGLIFKNAAIATTLTAHVYKGGVEVTGASLTELGAIKWYKDNGATAVANGTSLTISAGDVQNTATYSAKLEG